ncbi:MAG: CDP-glucose 4,6-dehydratase [Candidatus Binatia bacterium]
MENLVNPSAKFWDAKRVFITGHTGFKGAWLCHWLEYLGAKVTGFALPPDTEPNLFSLGRLDRYIDSKIGDIRKLDEILAAMHRAEPELVIHMAAQALVRRSYVEPVETYATNVMGTVHVLDAVREVGSVRVIINVTSDKCYENQEWVWAYRESEPMGGNDPYSSSKGCAELVTSSYRRSFFASQARGRSVALASVRAGNVIGGGDWANDRLIPDCIRGLMAGNEIQVRNPEAVRPWQHVLEPLSGYLILAERLWQKGDCYTEGWNFGPSEDEFRSVAWLVERVTGLWGKGARWRVQEGEHPHEATYLRVDSSKARARLGWRARLNLSDALDWTVLWYRRCQAGEDPRVVTLDQIQQYECLNGYE